MLGRPDIPFSRAISSRYAETMRSNFVTLLTKPITRS
jgi:hypothetical protein